MNAAQIKAYSELVRSLKESGVTHFKCEGTEICLGEAVKRETIAPPKEILTVQDLVNQAKGGKEEKEVEIPHVVQELASLLKLSDNELVDQLFPEPRDPNAEQVEA